MAAAGSHSWLPQASIMVACGSLPWLLVAATINCEKKKKSTKEKRKERKMREKKREEENKYLY